MLFILVILVVFSSRAFASECSNIQRRCQPCPPCARRPPKLFVYDIQKKMVISQTFSKKHPAKKKKRVVDSADHFALPRMSVIRSTNEAFMSQTVDLSKYPAKIVTSSPRVQGEAGPTPSTMSPLKMEVIMFNPKKYLEKTYKIGNRVTVNGDTDEDSSSVEFSKHLASIINSQESFSRVEGEIQRSTGAPSTIPTATPPPSTMNPLFRIKFTSYKKRRRLPKKITVPVSVPIFNNTSTTTVPTPLATDPIHPFPTLVYVKENTTNSETDDLETKNELTLDMNRTAGEVQVMPTGYKTNPNFSPDEVPIEDERCNDPELQKILVEGMKFDDSIMSKRSIGAILSSTKRNNISVLCSETEVAFRLVARKHCQLSAGKATCVLFVL